MTSSIEELQQKPSSMTVQELNERLALLEQEFVEVMESFLIDTGIGVSSVAIQISDQCDYAITTGLLFPETDSK
jgi:hypothetical protein